jgi:hypothetical protein
MLIKAGLDAVFEGELVWVMVLLYCRMVSFFVGLWPAIQLSNEPTLSTIITQKRLPGREAPIFVQVSSSPSFWTATRAIRTAGVGTMFSSKLIAFSC